MEITTRDIEIVNLKKRDQRKLAQKNIKVIHCHENWKLTIRNTKMWVSNQWRPTLECEKPKLPLNIKTNNREYWNIRYKSVETNHKEVHETNIKLTTMNFKNFK